MKEIILEKPQIDMDFPLMRAISLRRTKRKWKYEDLDMQHISNILWAACGETKKAKGKAKNRRTIASACSAQLIRVYAALDSGVYRYNEPEHKLEMVSEHDVRDMLGTQMLMRNAPFGLIYVTEAGNKTGIIRGGDEKTMFMAATETGEISQNVYLYCAASGLNTVLIALVDREKLAEKMNLREGSFITFTQIIGKEA
ncbi:MAG: nitroreductase family protein [Eubacteriales bacterium]